ncbi:hypothetical protein ACFS7Z_24700 [Pontibacter toksunensis]|uniref:SpoIIAA-like n=1 Tax=Pontibacter toksunensis TaxID=1332631 RepID=A0ABW6C1K7_9BACT
MILYENGFIKLDYDTSTCILCATCPDIQEYVLLQIHKAFTTIKETIANHDIKKLILDCRNTTIGVSEEDYAMVIFQFVYDLNSTPLQQFARILTTDAAKESKLRGYAREMGAEIKPEFAYKNFLTKAEAEAWLKEK